MSINTPEELAGMKAAGRVVRQMLEAMKAGVRSGATTRDLDEIGAHVMREAGARSAPELVYQFPGTSCISVNQEIVHGIPSDRKLRAGDVLKLDVTIEKDGFMADACETVIVGRDSVDDAPHGLGADLAACARRAFDAALVAARAGNRVADIGAAVEGEVRRSGFHVIRELCGHGIGRTIHERPSVPNYADPYAKTLLTDGLVITIEPIIASKSAKAYLASDGWTMRTSDRGLAAHHEHTMVITNSEPLLLTA
ncbi:type I methionyl aminopeptidase [Silvibacterium sp.]|uniref:type I methionyl aminopeptidase n=1 Tax=Silvibacterium sp. TaxID=1964179 RepID=UPI0039E4EC46